MRLPFSLAVTLVSIFAVIQALPISDFDDLDTRGQQVILGYRYVNKVREPEKRILKAILTRGS
jgi:hypothetical protein